MLRSMTGFGSGRASSERGTISVELRCLNHRFRDVKARLPRELASLEPTLLELVAERIERGSVEMTLRFLEQRPIPGEVRVHDALAEQVVEAMRAMKSLHGLAGDVTVEALFSVDGVMEVGERTVSMEGLKQLVEEAAGQALDKAVQMREEEGLALGRDLQKRVESILRAVDAVALEAREMPAVYRERIETRVKAILDESSVDPGRLESEVAFLAERSDITEELTRLGSHLEQLRSLIESSDECVGRRMGFLLQEMGREINTVGSKGQSLAISRLVVDMKAELERMREQVQNVE